MRNHVSNIFNKLQVADRAQAIIILLFTSAQKLFSEAERIVRLTGYDVIGVSTQ